MKKTRVFRTSADDQPRLAVPQRPPHENIDGARSLVFYFFNSHIIVHDTVLNTQER